MPARSRTKRQLREDALAIWQAGVTAADSDRLMRDAVRRDGSELVLGDVQVSLSDVRRIVVVGAGKASAGMASALETILGRQCLADKQVTGLINVPADCVIPLQSIELHSARPAGLNEPTEAGVAGSERILDLVSGAHPDDLCLCLLSGGGSALLPAPAPGISLADKQQVTRFLSSAGANIEELNTVRKALSRIKGGGLARSCHAQTLITLVISDVLGDPLDVIASGPTVSSSTGPAEALAVLQRFRAEEAGLPSRVRTFLEQASRDVTDRQGSKHEWPSVVENVVIGNNAVAVDAAGCEAERRGYSHAMIAATSLEGQAEEVGRHHLRMARRMRNQAGPDCLITGGEPVVQLVEENRRGKGGRNQQLVLAALQQALLDYPNEANPLEGIAMASGGTDGEDGPTDAAGALIDAPLLDQARQRGLNPGDFLDRNDAYHFFQPLDGLIQTGPTHTNVCDIRVVVVGQTAGK